MQRLLHGVFSDSLIADRKLRNCGPTLHQPVQNWKGDDIDDIAQGMLKSCVISSNL